MTTDFSPAQQLIKITDIVFIGIAEDDTITVWKEILSKICRKDQKELRYVLVSLEKAYDSVCKEVW